MSKPAERRESYRMPFATEVICHVGELNKKYNGTLRDLSITSLFMEAENCPDVGKKCNIDIILEGTNSRLEIKGVHGNIVRNDGDGVAISFDERLEWFALVPLYFQKLR